MQKWFAFAALALTALLAVGADDDAAKKEEVKKFAGVWKLESMTLDGEELDRERFKDWTWTIEGDKVTLSDGKDLTREQRFEPNPGKTPKEIDVTVLSGDAKGKVIHGVYKLEGDTLTICTAPPGKDRPTEFVSKADSGLRLGVFKRQKP